MHSEHLLLSDFHKSAIDLPGLLAALLEGKLGVRLNLLLGSALSTAGFVGGAFAPSLPLLVFSVGIISGEY